LAITKLNRLGGLLLFFQCAKNTVRYPLSYYDFPVAHWRHIRTNNPLERLNREIRRRTRVVGSFPDGHAALMLVAARLRYMAGQKWGTQRYKNMNQEISV